MNTKGEVELLAPAGSFDCLQAAINAGANAIYFGVEQLNMRTRSAKTFIIEDIKKVTDLCRQHGLKAYLTLNTVMYEHDMQLLRTILKESKRVGIDAVIASDFSVMQYCNEMGIPLHISTQANVSNIESVQFFSRFADVIVLARELTLKQVKYITNEIKRKQIKGPSGQLIKIELFVHGALCMAISGKCYLSLHTHNASANRGACVQNCRRAYIVKDAETGEELLIDNEYIMSPKDLCTIDILDQVLESGIDVLKIEGRTKGADYVHIVTQCYREAIEAVVDGTFNPDKVIIWKTEMEKVYNRGFWEGNYLGRNLGEWTQHPGSVATEKKVYIGKGTKYYPKIGIAEFTLETGNLKQGDRIMITGPDCGMVKEQLTMLVVNGAQAPEASKGDKITFPLSIKITASNKLYKLLNTTADE
ncbi:peptidase U32 family protein [Chryseobacterium daecheongense]|uniref:Protease n=1 Tax=Chryseobacterium daecheongense TaxID=192389 RepID=A0A3N0VYH2_9FLAO|nr:peptidase U32 family protein [Chryseobacterium daecheongense]ROH97861.1 U32 family peptidase [Chryseobacterium daecheongense]TDX92963.1 putative protease [Chryseobacterium daecheongense]